MQLAGALALLVACNFPFVLGAAYAQSPAAPTPTPRFLSQGSGGSGCNPQSFTGLVSTDQQIRLMGHPLMASIAPDAEATREFCLFDFVVSAGDGWQYALKQGADGLPSRHNVSVRLDNGVTAHYRESIEIVGVVERVNNVTVFTGPLKQEFVLQPKFDQESLIWSPCGGSTMVLARDLRLESPSGNATGSITVNVDIDLSPSKSFEWRQCTN